MFNGIVSRPAPKHALALGLSWCLFSAFALEAQTEATSRGWWGTLGGGLGTHGGGAAVAGATYRLGSHLLQARGSAVIAFAGDVAVGDVGVMYGRGLSGDYAFASASAGVSLADAEGPAGMSVGLPLALQLNWLITNGFGIGTQIFANLNTEQSAGGWIVQLQFGSFR